jgi:competence protein ComEC
MQPKATLISSIESTHELQLLRTSQRCAAGQRWDWDGVVFEVLSPQTSDYEGNRKSNALSCVLRISNGRQTALLTGDIEQPQEAELVASGAPLKADLLLVPHHGSKTSSSEAFLQAVLPKHALLQAGYRNRYGHPAAPVMARYAEMQIPVLESTRCGAATWKSTRPQEASCYRSQALRYWHHRVP